MNRCLTLEFVCSQQLFIKHSYILSVYQIPGIVVSDGDIIMSKEKKRCGSDLKAFRVYRMLCLWEKDIKQIIIQSTAKLQ